MASVFIVRDARDRYIQGVYRYHSDALQCIEDKVDEVVNGVPEWEIDEEYKEHIRSDYEILQMTIE